MAIRQRKQVRRVGPGGVVHQGTAVNFNERAVAAHLYRRNPQKYQRTVKTSVGTGIEQRTDLLQRDTQKLRKKVMLAKSRRGKAVSKSNKPINAKLVTAPATLVKTPSAGSGSVGSSVSGSQDRANLRRLGAVAVVNRAYRQRVLTAPKALRNLGTYKFGN